jgi:hypothetical protein
LHAGAAGRHFTSPAQTTVKVTCISVHTAGRGESETDGRRMSFQFCLDLDLGPCLVLDFFLKFHYAKRRFPVISKYRHMYEVLNVDEIKN